MFSLVRIAALASSVCLATALGGCDKSSNAEVDMQSGPHAAGKKVFMTYCAGCHKIGGPAGAEGRAPDLAKIGADPNHSADWFIELIRKPKSKNPNAKMRAFGDSIKDEDLHALAGFLVSLK